MYYLSLEYVKEWAATVEKAVSKQKKEGYAEEDIGIILNVASELPGRYILLFQKLIQLFSRTKITVQFDLESLSQEKDAIIICGLKIWCPHNIFKNRFSVKIIS